MNPYPIPNSAGKHPKPIPNSDRATGGWRWYRLVIALLCFFAAAGWSRDQRPTVRVITIDGVISPLTANYLEHQLRDAQQTETEAVVLRLDTPGGLVSSMRRMTEAILASPVPVVVYVAPPGARAASAGMFITLSGHLAAMAPGTNIGAAHPVNLTGSSDTSLEKTVQDAAAYARSLAETRGHNAAWAEQAVKQSASLSAQEALEQHVVDLISPDVPDLLRRIDGRSVVTAAGTVTLRTAGANIVERPMGTAERLLLMLIDPNIAYLLFILGCLGIIAELYHPGTLVPGLAGAISLILAFTAFGSLPVNWAGVLLMLLAFGLMLGEAHAPGFGVLGGTALVAFILGSLFLFSPAAGMPGAAVNPWLILLLTTAVALFFLVALRLVLRARHAPVVTGIEALIGRFGVATTALNPRGTVRLDGESWSAETLAEPIEAGAEIQVADVRGVVLKVRRVP